MMSKKFNDFVFLLKFLDWAKILPLVVPDEAVNDVVVASKVRAEVLVPIGNVPDDHSP
jgi:hypothetical protein